MSEEKLKEIKDSIDFQLRVCELKKYEPDMIIEEKELYDYAINLQQKIDEAIDYIKYINIEPTFTKVLLEILGDKE